MQINFIVMLKKLATILFSTRLTAVLFIFFAIAMATGTLLDASAETSPTPYTKELIYDAWWFELIMLLFMINFIGNISRYQLFKKEKWATLVLHLAFILIIFGAFITRYISYEGAMHIREGATENKILSSETYITAFIDGDYEVNGVKQRRVIAPKKVRLSDRLDNNFTIETDYKGKPVTIKFKEFKKNAKEGIIPSNEGEDYLKIVESGTGKREEHWLKSGEVQNIHNVLFALNKPTDGAINLLIEGDSTAIESPFPGNYMIMADQTKGSVVADSLQPFHLRSLYQLGGMSFVVPEPVIKGKYGVIKAPKKEKTNQDAVLVSVQSGNEEKDIWLLGGKGTVPAMQKVTLNGLDIYVGYGSKEIELPFSITLNDFIAEKYPGTQRGFSSFKSKITVNKPNNQFYDYDIYMNHVLDENGYRFFQSGFDPDEKGTILSVNHDFWGTWITYIGYTLLYIGLLGILFTRNSRFGSLKKQLKKVHGKQAKITTLLLLFISFSAMAQENASHQTFSKQQIDSLIQANAVDKSHALKFAQLVIQDNGRMKPVNTFASELLRKISHKTHYQGLDANQVFLSMTEFPRLWVEAPIIYLKRGNDSIRKIIGVPLERKEIALIDLFDEKGNYKLEPYLEDATRTTNPNQFQKDFIKTHENFYLLNQALSGSILKVFPIPNDASNKWISYPELSEANIKGNDSLYVKNILPMYFETLKQARKTNDYSQADKLLESITAFQKKFGSKVLPPENKIKAEILYNKADIFNRMYKFFTLIGILMFVFVILQIFYDNKLLNFLVNVCKYLIWLSLIILTSGLILRWYVSGHAPWSDAYESIVYVGWATVLFGLVLGRKSALTIASTAFVAAIILWVAHQNWIDPSISNLQPVLNSYWLMIHVAIIVASYGPFTLGMILGATVLLLMILTNSKNKQKMNLHVKELLIITEMALIVGLVLLTIGNFLGGQWANESWGRYWGWDPKETWALISIMIYAFVVHMRLVPGLRGKWQFAAASVFAYASIMMTYYGVNFYLVGLHSYASGEKTMTPNFVWYTIIFFIILSTLAYFKYKKYYKKG